MDNHKDLLLKHLQISMDIDVKSLKVLDTPEKRKREEGSSGSNISPKRSRYHLNRVIKKRREKPTSVKYNQSTDSSSDACDSG